MFPGKVSVTTNAQRQSRQGLVWHWLWLLLSILGGGSMQVHSAELPADAIGFFTNVAGRLLRAELNVDLNHIEIFPTNQYSPALHRLLQVTANLYDATTNRGSSYPYYPTVYRPIFGTNESSIFIAGYVEETGTEVLNHPWHDLNDAGDRVVGPNDNVYGIPLIIGARKGFPNFNKVAQDTIVTVMRRVELEKTNATDRLPQWTNQMFTVGLSNIIGLQAWNSYTSTYPRMLEMRAMHSTTITLTNNDGFTFSTNIVARNRLPVEPQMWQGYQRNMYGAQYSFRVPLFTNEVMLPASVYRYTDNGVFRPHFEPLGAGAQFERYPLRANTWGLAQTNRLTFFLLDNGRIVDAVAFRGGSILPLSDYLNASVSSSSSRYVSGVWDPTPLGASYRGLQNQIIVSFLSGASSLQDWLQYSTGPFTESERQAAITGFRAFLGMGGMTPPLTNRWLAPFTPIGRILQQTTWEVNDPLVHYMTNDWIVTTNLYYLANNFYNSFTNMGLFSLNKAYHPWNSDIYYREESTTDPGVSGSEQWNFPTNQSSLLSCLGRIHRGTPWQTLYLKGRVAPLDLWLYPYGPGTSASTHPTNDWRLVGLLASFLNTNAPRALLSINETNPIAWAAALNGMTVISNTPDFTPVSLQISSNSPQVYMVTDGLARRRSLQPSQYFHRLGDILETYELSIRSPWINWNDPSADFLDDAAYEALPQQLLPLLREDPAVALRWDGNQFVLELQAFGDGLLDVEASVDLQQWERIYSGISANQRIPLSEVSGANGPLCFFRARLSE